VVEEVTDEYGLYRVNASGAEFAVRKWENYHPQVGEVWIFTNQKS
jgi:hypothetical protein